VKSNLAELEPCFDIVWVVVENGSVIVFCVVAVAAAKQRERGDESPIAIFEVIGVADRESQCPPALRRSTTPLGGGREAIEPEPERRVGVGGFGEAVGGVDIATVMEGGFALEKRFDGDDRSCRPKRRVRDVVSRSEITLGNELSGDVVYSLPGNQVLPGTGFAPQTVDVPSNGSATSTLTINTNTATPTGTFTVTAEGRSGSTTRSTPVTLTVLAPEFSVEVSPASQTVLRGGGVSYGVTVRSVGGFSGQVDLAALNLPGDAQERWCANRNDGHGGAHEGRAPGQP